MDGNESVNSSALMSFSKASTAPASCKHQASSMAGHRLERTHKMLPTSFLTLLVLIEGVLAKVSAFDKTNELLFELFELNVFFSQPNFNLLGIHW